jgi:hypothetical protein
MAAPPKGLGSAVVASHMAIDIFAWVACLCRCVKPKSTMTNVVHTQNKHGCDSKLFNFHAIALIPSMRICTRSHKLECEKEVLYSAQKMHPKFSPLCGTTCASTCDT